jgi:hypothetical protein
MSDERQEVTQEQFEVIKAVLGADAETFKRTKVGQYIYGRIANEEEQLIEDLIAADPEDAKLQREIRNEIYKRRTLPLFIEEAIQTGHAAQRNLEQMESNQQDY